MGSRIIIGDAAPSLSVEPAESVQLVVTSPPYWTIKDYEHPGQIGQQDTYSGYLNRLDQVWKECFRVLSPGCKIAVNIGDQFLRASENYGVYQIVPIHADVITRMIKLGFRHLGSIIWQKITTTKTTGGGVFMGSLYYPRDGYITYEHEYILLFKKPGKGPKPSPEAKELSRLTKEQRSEWFRGIWKLPPERKSKHPAPFPIELPDRLIRMFSYHGETVLDPFAGGCTTLIAAIAASRNSIGIELNPKWIPERLK